MRKKKKILIGFLVGMLLIPYLQCLPVFASSTGTNPSGGTATERQATFLNYYKDSAGLTLDINTLTSQDYYVLSVFMSNYYQPGVTTLKDLQEPNGSTFFNNFSSAVGKSGDAQLEAVVKAIGSDTAAGLESGKCTLVTSNGKIINGADFLSTMANTVSISGSTAAITGDSKIYFGSGGNLAIDFTSKAMRAAFQTMMSYNPDLFFTSNGIESLDILFVDAVGNIWGVEAGSQSSQLSTTTTLSGMIAAFGADKVYLLMPACLNPATFSSGITNQEDLKMPLMNRFVLGSLMGASDFGADVQTMGDEPFYNLLSTSGVFSKTRTGLAVFGVHSLSNYLLATGDVKLSDDPSSVINTGVYGKSWTDEKRKVDTGYFLYNPDNIYLDTTQTNGIGKIATNSYIVFAPTMSTLSSGSKQDNTNALGNRTIDMVTGLTQGTKAFSVFGTSGSQINSQKKLLTYLYSPTALNLNQVSMNFFYSPSSSIASSSDASGDFARHLYDYTDAQEIVASKMGMRGLSLFMSDISSAIKLADGNIVGMKADKMIPSNLVSRLTKEFSIALNDESIYTNVRNGKYTDFTGETLNLVKNLAEGTTEGFNPTSAPWSIPSTYISVNTTSTSSTNPWRVAVNPKGFVNIGDSGSDLSFARTAGLGDVYLHRQVAGLTNGITDTKKTDALATNLKDNMTLEYVLGNWGYSIFTPSDAMRSALGVSATKETGTLFGNSAATYTAGLYLADISNQDLMMGIYFGYLIDMTGITSCDETGVTFKGFSSVFLPKYNTSAKGGDLSFSGEDTLGTGVINSDDLSFEEKQKDLINRIYGLTTDSNNDYRNSLIKNIMDGVIITIHRTVTGTWLSSMGTVTAGTASTYQSVTGYIYTPTLEELSFTAGIMNNYQKLYIACMLVILFLVILMLLANTRGWRECVIIVMLMAVALLFPYILITNSINISNKVADSVYSDRFDFWALSQHQQSISSLANTMTMTEKDKFLTLTTATADLTYTGDTGVKIKWMSPKKVEIFQDLYSDKSLSESFVTNAQIFKWLFNSFIYDSEFVDTDVYGSYLYRPYNTIALEGKAYYSWIKSLESTPEYKSTIDYVYNGYGFKGINTPFTRTLEQFKVDSSLDDNYIAGMARMDSTYYVSGQGYLTYSAERLNDLEVIGQYDPSGTGNKEADSIAFMGSLNDQISARMVEEITTNSIAGITSNLPTTVDDNAFAGKDIRSTSKAIYLKNTESPYYYFYSVLKYRYGDGGLNGSFKNTLLENKMFRVNPTEAESLDSTINPSNTYRDFLDLEGLFTYMIPYMQEGNSYVSEWQAINGSEISQYDFEYDVNADGAVNSETGGKLDLAAGKDGSSSYIDEVTKKNNMNKVWNMYCPWVDSLYDLDIYNKKVKVGGSNLVVEDTLNPSSYLQAGRPMIFSEAEMLVRGYNYKDLTDTERRIQAVTEKTYTDLMYLVNYYDMDDEVLLAAAAMYATFNFNAEFSDSSLVGSSVMQYPQGFELKNFNYDAFMRLALLNSTGESIFATEDLYTRILTKTSVISGILLIVCDIIACIVIPTFKLVILVGLFLLGILICVTCVISPPDKIFKAVSNSLLIPTCSFMVLNICFALVMSIIIGEGLTAYVGSKGLSVVTNDPTVTLLLIILVGAVYIYFAWKIVKVLLQAYKTFGLSTFFATVGTAGAVAQGITKRAISKAKGITSSGAGAIVGAATAGEGNRLTGALEGTQKGVKGTVITRGAEKRSTENLAKAIAATNASLGSKNTIGDKIDSLATKEANVNKTTKEQVETKATVEEQEKVNEVKPNNEKFEKATEKGANAMGKALSSMAYGKEKVKDGVRAGAHKTVMAGMTLQGSALSAVNVTKQKARDVKGLVKETPSSVKNYTKSALDTLNYDNAYYKELGEVRDINRTVEQIKKERSINKTKREIETGYKKDTKVK